MTQKDVFNMRCEFCNCLLSKKYPNCRLPSKRTY
jgi:hypothetical protein